MNNTEKTIFENDNSISETLFIPLCAKAKETQNSNPIIKDNKALEIINELKFNQASADGGNITHIGIIVRTEILDTEVKRFMDSHPNGVIINLGAGLDTRISRIDNGKVRWFDIDLPDVINLRKKFFKESERVKFISKSIFDYSWISDINIEKDAPVIIIAEGLLMYFEDHLLREFFKTVIDSFPNALMYFDVVHSYFIGKGISHKFLWGVSDAIEVENLDPRINMIKHWSTGEFHKNRQALFLRIMNIFSSTRNRSQIIAIDFKSLRPLRSYVDTL